MHTRQSHLIPSRNARLGWISAALLLVVACDDAYQGDQEPPGLAAEDAQDVVDESSAASPEALGLGEGWIAVEPGLWALYDDQGDRKLLGIGEAGRVHALASLGEAEAELEQRLAERDSADARESLAELRGLIAAVAAEEAEEAEEPSFRCSFSVQGLADAYPITCGAAAKSSASYAHPCGSTVGTVKTYASASCGYQTKTHQCGPYAADPASCSSTSSITGAGPCSSYSFAQITGSGINVYIWDQNSQRGACGGGTTTTNGPGTNPCPDPDKQCQ
ncbi:MAG: hypothetical protein JNL82_27785 [Myxococcales bacterium]|nr:hypothetical protein [Myxococcales bacterium]